MLKQFLEAGRIVSTQGLKGEVRVESWCDTPKFLTQFESFRFADGNFRKVQKSRVQKSIVVVKFADIDDIESAQGLVKSIIYIDRAWVKLPEGSYFDQDLMGLSVTDAVSGRVFGKITEVSHINGANDIYRVVGDCVDEWIPGIPDVVKSVDFESGKMIITPLEGLFSNEN